MAPLCSGYLQLSNRYKCLVVWAKIHVCSVCTINSLYKLIMYLSPRNAFYVDEGINLLPFRANPFLCAILKLSIGHELIHVDIKSRV